MFGLFKSKQVEEFNRYLFLDSLTNFITYSSMRGDKLDQIKSGIRKEFDLNSLPAGNYVSFCGTVSIHKKADSVIII